MDRYAWLSPPRAALLTLPLPLIADPTGVLDTVTFSQHCGGHFSSNGTEIAFIYADTLESSTEGAKGFLCPWPSICIVSGLRPPRRAPADALADCRRPRIPTTGP